MKPLSAAPDAAAGSGSTLSLGSVTGELAALDTTVLDRLATIRLEETKLEEFRARADEMKSRVSPQVYRRVVDDYTRREATLEQQSTPLKAKARAEYRKLRQLVDQVTLLHEQARLEKEELEFRHAVGELDDAQLADGAREPQRRLNEYEENLARLNEYKARFVEALGSEAALEEPAPAPPPRLEATRTSAAAPAAAGAPPREAPAAVEPAAPTEPVDAEATVYVAPPVAPPPSTPAPAADTEATMLVSGEATQLVPPPREAPGPAAPPPALASAAAAPPPPATPPDHEEPEEATILVPMAALIVEPGTLPRTEYRLGAINYVGRADDNQIQILSPEVSRKHAVITAAPGGFELKDLGSQNGVSVNGSRIKQHRLADGDRIEIAGFSLVFRSPWPVRGAGAEGLSRPSPSRR